MARIYIKGAIIPVSQTGYYKEQNKPYTTLDDIKLPTNGEELEVCINSVGGSIEVAGEIYTQLRQYGGPVRTVIAGLAASAASVVAMAGDVVEISPLGYIMIHNPLTTTYGNKSTLRKTIETLDTLGEGLADIYHKKTGIPVPKILEMMEAETWLTSSKAIELGFADRLIGEKKKLRDQPGRSFTNSTPTTGRKKMSQQEESFFPVPPNIKRAQKNDAKSPFSDFLFDLR